jgi:hypothetical protein
MPFVGKSGADAIFTALEKICRVLAKYHAKCDEAIDTAEANSVITSDQATSAHLFVDTAVVTCDIFRLVAGNSGF